MSIFIKGMDMPYGCANCSFLNGPVYDCRGRAEYFCNIPIDGICGKSVTDQVIDMYEGGGNGELYFAEWCPLSEVPESHGDLIDRQALLKTIVKRLGISSIEYFTHQEQFVVANIDDAPTVIPASEEEI